MRQTRPLAHSWVLRLIGALLLGADTPLVMHMLTVARGKSGHEPTILYFFAIIAFAVASSGAALLIHGRHLFDRIVISERWVSHAPRAMQDSNWVADLDPNIPKRDR